MSFARPDLLWLAFALPALVLVGIIGYFRRRRRVARLLGEAGLIQRIGGEGLEIFPASRLLFIVPAALLLGLAAAGPQWGTERVETHGRALNLALVLDVSRSMLARDLEPNRLERQRLFATRLLRELRGDRIGLVAFAGRAYTLAPLTTDHSALHLYLDALDPDIISQGGSSLAAAITQGVDLVRDASSASRDRVVVLVSDGEALEDESAVIAAIDRARNHGVTIHAVGVGTPAGAPVPELDPAGYTIGYKRDPDTGEIVISRLGEGLLERAATITGGRYSRSDHAGATDAILAQIRGMERTSSAGGSREVPRPRYTWFIALALALIAADVLLARRTAGQGTRTMRAATLALLCGATLAFGIGDLERGNRLYRQGRYKEAVAAYQAALEGGDDSPTLHYNLGTALLRLGRHQEAEEHLRNALATIEPEERERILFNLGNRYLDAGRNAADPRARDQMLAAAAEAYRDALRLDPADEDAKWNLELTVREQEQSPPSSGGDQQDQQQNPQQQSQDDSQGGQGDPSTATPPPGANTSPSPDDHRDPGELSQEEAERLLSAVEQAERDLQRSRLRKGKRDTPVARDW